MLKKPSHDEEEYFARAEIERRRALALESNHKLEDAERDRLQKLHHMKCPKCGYDLERIDFRGIGIDKCFHCNGTFLDAGELELLAGHAEENLVHKIAHVFKR